MAQTADVLNGLGLWSTWLDYDKVPFLQRNWTLSTYYAGILTNFVALVLTLAAPRLFLIVQRIFEVYSVRPKDTQEYITRQVGATVDSVEADNNREPSEPLPRDATGVAVAVEGSTDPSSHVESGLHNEAEPVENSFSLDLCRDISIWDLGKYAYQDTAHPGVSTAQSIASTAISTPPETIGTNRQGDEDVADPDPHERSTLLSAAPAPPKNSKLSNTFMRRESPQGASLELFMSIFNQSHGWVQIVFRILIAILCFAFFILVTIVAIYSVWIASQPTSLSASGDCGIWVLDPSVNSISPFNYMQEKEAGDYATRCYNASDGADGCNFFLSQNIPFDEVDGASCPFADGFCLENHNSYTLTTGLVSSKRLGINVPSGYTFNRTTTCSPIQREGYIGVDEDLGLIEYYYGAHKGISEDDLTWLSFPNYRTWTATGYQVQPFCSVDADGGWHPILEFLPADNPEVTLMLVYSQRNYHREFRWDPVFPAMSMLRVGSELLYLNFDLVATVLACTDKTSICDATGQICWDAFEDPPFKSESKVELNGLLMLQLALLRSNTCHSILYRGGSALDANSKVYVDRSMPLAAEQWKVEAKNLFAASLARMQIDLRDHVRGAAAHEPGFVNLLTPRMSGICNQYKFKSSGWTNISVWGFVCAMAGSLLVFALTIQIKDPNEDGKMKSDKLSAEVLFSWVCSAGNLIKVLVKIFPWIAEAGRRSWNTVKGWFKRPEATNAAENAV